jgi:hypothetical protein
VRLTYRTPTVTSIGGRGGHVRGANGILDVELGIPTELGIPIEASAVDAHIGLCSQDHDAAFMLVAELHVTLPMVWPGADAAHLVGGHGDEHRGGARALRSKFAAARRRAGSDGL